MPGSFVILVGDRDAGMRSLIRHVLQKAQKTGALAPDGPTPHVELFNDPLVLVNEALDQKRRGNTVVVTTGFLYPHSRHNGLWVVQMCVQFGIPLVFMSGGDEHDAEYRQAEKLAPHNVRKPFRPEELVAVVRKAVELPPTMAAA